MRAGIRVFQGLSVRDDPTIISDKKTPDCGNVRIDNPIGALSNIRGIEKYNSIGFGAAIVAIHQLNGHIFSLSGDKLYEGYPAGFDSYGSQGSGIGEFYRPYGIHYDSASEFIYVGDRNNSRIVKTKIDGTGWITLSGFSFPHGIHYDSAREFIYVADYNNNRIVKTKIDGTGWTTLGGFSFPAGIHYDSASEFIYVNDTGNNYIVKTKIDGTGWTTYGSQGSGIGEFYLPYGIHYDSASKYIYVADYLNSRIVKTDAGWA